MATPLPLISPAAEKGSESMATPPLPSISPAAEKSSESMATPPPPSSIFESMGIPPLPLSILRRAEKSSESMDPLALISSVCRHISLMMGMSDASIGSVTASTSFHTCPSTLVDCSDIDDSDPSLSTAAEVEYENDASPASNLGPWHHVKDENLKKKFKEWQKYEPLVGSDSSMYEVTTDNGTFFTVMEFLLGEGHIDFRRSLQLEKDIKFCRQFEHENIVQYIGTDKDDEKLYAFLELMPRGSLSTFCCQYGLTESQVSAYASQILKGLKYLHDLNVTHRDIRCANILVGASGSVKLNFGLANAIESNKANSFGGTIYWMAPEVVNNGRNGSYGLAADIWSLGCTVLEMLTCRPPYSGIAPGEAVARIYAGVPPEIPESLPINAQDFIHECLQADPQDRPSAAQLLDHPFVSRPPN